jgi:hypothetical protein
VHTERSERWSVGDDSAALETAMPSIDSQVRRYSCSER